VFDLERFERLVVAILVVSILAGSAFVYYKRSRERAYVHIGKFDTRAVSPERDGTANHGVSLQKKININEAGPDELMAIRGIGKALADRIIEYRSLKGPFSALEDIKNIRGVGPSLYEKIKDQISIE
jgi:comEA protein